MSDPALSPDPGLYDLFVSYSVREAAKDFSHPGLPNIE
jgi:hypothetical protein